MGIVDKIKNLFYEDEVIEVPKESLKEEVAIQKKEVIQQEVKKDELDDVVSERDLLKSETTFKFPVIFEDEDFADMEKEKPKAKPEKKEPKVNSNNTSNYKKPTLDREVIREVIEKPKRFSPSPVISPVYGLLDKDTNKKVGSKGSTSLEHTKEMVINFDTIRKKAYGSLTDDIENSLSSNEKDIDDIEQEIDNILGENNLLSDLEEDVPEENSTTLDNDSEYNYRDFGVEYKIDEPVTRESKLHKDEKIKRESKKEKLKEISDDNDEKEVELTEDLFNLIDSMYDR